MSDPSDFASVWTRASDIDGWLTRDQAQLLFAEAHRTDGGLVVEIGSHLGRSTVVLAGAGARVIAIDPFPPDWRYGLPDTAGQFAHNIRRAGVQDRVTLHPRPSTDVLATWSGGVRLVYVDGKHDMLSCLADLRWTRHLAAGDRYLVHDAFSSLGVTSALLWRLLTDRRSRFLRRTGSLALYEVAPPKASDRLRVLSQLPWFCRNAVVKVLLRLGARPLAKLLGHEGSADPY